HGGWQARRGARRFSLLSAFMVSSALSPSAGGADVRAGLGRLRGLCRRCKHSCFVGFILCGGIAELEWLLLCE
ncbi:hypothetical protein FN846DRAFT_982904, partial [Sphaerosporella brunnea]